MRIYDLNDQITTPYNLKAAFAAYERDVYPLGLYAALLDYLQETVSDDILELDIIGLDCDIEAAQGFEEIADVIGVEEEELVGRIWEDIVDQFAAQVDYFLFADESAETIYYI